MTILATMILIRSGSCSTANSVSYIS